MSPSKIQKKIPYNSLTYKTVGGETLLGDKKAQSYGQHSEITNNRNR